MKLMLLAGLLAAGPALAAGPCGADAMATLRVSKLTPGGTKAGFDAAVRDHRGWYVANRMTDDVFVTGPTLIAAKGGMVPPATQFVTIHVYGSAEPKRDVAWEAYVAKYRANSTIVSETRFCLTKGTAITAR